MNRSRWHLAVRLCGAAYTATGIRTPALVPLDLRSVYRGVGL